MKHNKMRIFAKEFMVLLFVSCLVGCSSDSAIDLKVSVSTHRITRKTTGAIKANDTNEISLNDNKLSIKLTEDYRYVTSYDKKTEITTYFVWNPTIANTNADKLDGRAEGEYEKELEVAFDNAKEKALEKINEWNPFKKKADKEAEIAELEDDVFIFDKDAYITEYHDDIMLYVYSGIDRISPAGVMDSSQVRSSALTYFQNSLAVGIPTIRNTLWDTSCCPAYSATDITSGVAESNKTNGDYFSLTFTSNSGDYVNTTYGTQIFPKTYYGVFLIDKEAKEGSLRRWYLFVFTNDSVGNIVDETIYNSIFAQFKSEFGVNQFYTVYDKQNFAYEAKTDYSKGKSYTQLKDAFTDTYDYYIIKGNKKSDDSSDNIEDTSHDEKE